MGADRKFDRRTFLKLGVVAFTGAIAAGCLPTGSALRTVRIDVSEPAEKKDLRIGEVEMTQKGSDVQIVTKNPLIARKVEMVIAEECEATGRTPVDSKSVTRRLKVPVEDCINSVAVKKRIMALLP